MWQTCDVIVASMDTAKRDPHREIVLGLDYDMLIVDEAHKLKNKKQRITSSSESCVKNIACCLPLRPYRTILKNCTI